MNKIFRPPTEVIEVGTQLGLLAPTALAHHAPRCVCGAPLTWLSSHGVPFDDRLCLARPDAEGSAEGFHAFDGSRVVRRLALGPNNGEPRGHGIAGFRLHFLLHRCPRWNGLILGLTAKELAKEASR